jgi:hypothetical protein
VEDARRENEALKRELANASHHHQQSHPSSPAFPPSPYFDSPPGAGRERETLAQRGIEELGRLRALVTEQGGQLEAAKQEIARLTAELGRTRAVEGRAAEIAEHVSEVVHREETRRLAERAEAAEMMLRSSHEEVMNAWMFFRWIFCVIGHHTFTHACICTHIHTHTHTHMHTYIHTYIHTHIYSATFAENAVLWRGCRF